MEPPVIRKVPKAPSFVAGVANIRGRIVPMLNPIDRFGLPPSANQQSTINNPRLVLVQLESSFYGILVDRIASIAYLSEEMIEPLNPFMVDKEAAFITGMAKYEERVIHLLDLEAFIMSGLVTDQEEMVAYESFAAKMGDILKQSTERRFRRVLALSIADETYGVNLSGLSEVIPVQKMEQTDLGREYLAGIVKARDGIFPVIDLQKKFNLESSSYTESSRIVVLDAGQYGCGLLANGVTEILNITDEEIKEAPAVTSADNSAHIQGVAMLEEGQRLVILLDETRLLNTEEVETLQTMDTIDMTRNIDKKKKKKDQETLTFVTFKVADVEFAFRLPELSEVIHYKEPTRIPKAPPFVKGMIAVRGELVSVIDLRTRFDLNAVEETANPRILIVRKGKTLYGIMADSIAEIVKAAEDELVPPPPVVKGIESAFMQEIIMLKETDRTPIILNIEAIMRD